MRLPRRSEGRWKWPRPTASVSYTHLNFMAGALEKRARRSGKRPLMTTFSVYNLARNNCFDSGKAIRELGYHTRPYEETLRDEVEWLVRTGKVKAAAQAQGKHAAAHA